VTAICRKPSGIATRGATFFCKNVIGLGLSDIFPGLPRRNACESPARPPF